MDGLTGLVLKEVAGLKEVEEVSVLDLREVSDVPVLIGIAWVPVLDSREVAGMSIPVSREAACVLDLDSIEMASV